MTVESMRKIFWFLLFLEAVVFIFFEHAALKALRIREFSEEGNAEIWQAFVLAAGLAMGAAFLASVVIAIGSKKLMRIHSLPERLWCLGLAALWPPLVFVVYGVLVGYPAS